MAIQKKKKKKQYVMTWAPHLRAWQTLAKHITLHAWNSYLLLDFQRLKDLVVKLTLDILPVLVIKKVSRIRQLVLEDISNCYFFLMSNGIYFRSCLLNWLNEKWQFIKDMLYARGLGISQCITLHIWVGDHICQNRQTCSCFQM